MSPNDLCARRPEGDDAYVRCRLLDGTVVRYSATDLEKAIRELETLGHRYSTR